jgi:hypothetical protein
VADEEIAVVVIEEAEEVRVVVTAAPLDGFLLKLKLYLSVVFVTLQLWTYCLEYDTLPHTPPLEWRLLLSSSHYKRSLFVASFLPLCLFLCFCDILHDYTLKVMGVGLLAMSLFGGSSPEWPLHYLGIVLFLGALRYYAQQHEDHHSHRYRLINILLILFMLKYAMRALLAVTMCSGYYGGGDSRLIACLEYIAFFTFICL